MLDPSVQSNPVTESLATGSFFGKCKGSCSSFKAKLHQYGCSVGIRLESTWTEPFRVVNVHINEHIKPCLEMDEQRTGSLDPRDLPEFRGEGIWSASQA